MKALQWVKRPPITGDGPMRQRAIEMLFTAMREDRVLSVKEKKKYEKIVLTLGGTFRTNRLKVRLYICEEARKLYSKHLKESS